jgi:hypothetical protein
MEILLAWMMSCPQYHGAIQRLYADPYFQKPAHHQERKQIHEFFKTKTWPECLETEA